MNTYIAVFIGGGFGSISRYGISKLVTSNFQNINPEGTLIANIISTTILGITLFFFADKNLISSPIKALIVTGFCGGFSTFSTFSFETFQLFKTGYYSFAIANVIVSVILALLVLFVLSKFN